MGLALHGVDGCCWSGNGWGGGGTGWWGVYSAGLRGDEKGRPSWWPGEDGGGELKDSGMSGSGRRCLGGVVGNMGLDVAEASGHDLRLEH